MPKEKQNCIQEVNKMDDKNKNTEEKFEALEVIDKTDFDDNEFEDEKNNK